MRVSRIYKLGVMTAFLLIFGCKGQNHGMGEKKQDTGKNTPRIIRNGTNPSYEGSAEHFTGNVRITQVFDKNITTQSAAGAFVTFEPEARTHWHMHPKGQILIITDGLGYTQFEGEEIQEVGIGDTIICPPGIKHWHGASPDSYMTHFTITGELKGENVQWMQPVTDEQYFQH